MNAHPCRHSNLHTPGLRCRVRRLNCEQYSSSFRPEDYWGVETWKIGGDTYPNYRIHIEAAIRIAVSELSVFPQFIGLAADGADNLDVVTFAGTIVVFVTVVVVVVVFGDVGADKPVVGLLVTMTSGATIAAPVAPVTAGVSFATDPLTRFVPFTVAITLRCLELFFRFCLPKAGTVSKEKEMARAIATRMCFPLGIPDLQLCRQSKRHLSGGHCTRVSHCKQVPLQSRESRSAAALPIALLGVEMAPPHHHGAITYD